MALALTRVDDREREREREREMSEWFGEKIVLLLWKKQRR
jgi:hypothetical protein